MEKGEPTAVSDDGEKKETRTAGTTEETKYAIFKNTMKNDSYFLVKKAAQAGHAGGAGGEEEGKQPATAREKS